MTDPTSAQHNDHRIARALYAIADALSEGSDHDSHVFRRLAYQASLPKPECVIPGLVVTSAELRAAREPILNGPDDNGALYDTRNPNVLRSLRGW